VKTAEPQVNVYGERGQAVVLIHGLAGLFNSWEHNIPALSQGFRIYEIILPDFRDAPDGLDMEDYHDYMVAMFRALGVGRAAVIGHSLGGRIAAMLAATLPAEVSALVLVASAGLPVSTETFRRVLHKQPSRDDMPQLLATVFHNPTAFHERLIDSAHETFSDRGRFRSLIRTARKLKGHSIEDALSRIEAPTLIVWGSDDKIAPVNLAEVFRSRIRGAELAIFEQCGHAPQIEYPSRFNELVAGFLGAAHDGATARAAAGVP
jgi:4,5:9,10-diseco-3-hydroxy-5,9,17-trioxoandrosta-1(10),2-diene-4-oate hydrolase